MLNLEQKLSEICKEYGVPYKYVIGPSRNWEFLQIRRYFAKYCRTQRIPYAVIGRILNRHHATIINLVKK